MTVGVEWSVCLYVARQEGIVGFLFLIKTNLVITI